MFWAIHNMGNRYGRSGCIALAFSLALAGVVFLLDNLGLGQAQHIRAQNYDETVAMPDGQRLDLGSGTLYTVTYHSTVDGASLAYHEYLPVGYTANQAYKLALLLPGSGGVINQYDRDNPYTWTVQADLRGYILMTVQPRQLSGYPTYRYTFYMDSALAPGEQDIMDALDHERSRRAIDPDRIYIGGYSMGGFGALNLAALHPGLFAASAPGAPISDLFEQWDYAPDPPTPNFATLFHGVYAQTALTDTYWYQNSPRFLLANLMHTPVRVIHGTSDTVIPNSLAIWRFMESRHIIDVAGFTDSRGRAMTLQEMSLLWPGSYIEEHSWPVADHGLGSLYYRPDEVLAFFDAHVRESHPATVAFTTYDDRHTHAYWLEMNLVQPWTATPGSVYARRLANANALHLQVSGSITLAVDLNAVGLLSLLPLTCTVEPIGASGSSNLALVLAGAWQVGADYLVRRDGWLLPGTAYAVKNGSFWLLRQSVDIAHTYVISPDGVITFVYLPFIRR
jgi:predicted peptidase